MLRGVERTNIGTELFQPQTRQLKNSNREFDKLSGELEKATDLLAVPQLHHHLLANQGLEEGTEKHLEIALEISTRTHDIDLKCVCYYQRSTLFPCNQMKYELKLF